VCGWDVLQVGPQPGEKVAKVLRTDLGPGSLDVSGPFNFDTVAPPLLETADLVFSRPVIGPPGFDIVLDTI
jgi:hypothetical protein